MNQGINKKRNGRVKKMEEREIEERNPDRKTEGQNSREYYRQRAIQRRRERELKKRRRKTVSLALIALAVILAIIITTVSCVGGCGNKSVKTSAATGESGIATDQTEAATAAPTEAATANADGSVDPSYFDDAVFVGDSVTVSFSMYVESQRSSGENCLGKAYVLANGSLGYSNALNPIGSEYCVLPTYQGVQQTLEDSIAQIGAKKVYIMLGMNDVANDFDYTMENVKTVIGNIKDKSPDARIYIESVTPAIRSMQGESVNNERITAFNNRMKAFAEQNDYPYLDIYSVVADDEGYLRDEYCSDPDAMGIHFTFDADAAWEQYLLRHPEGK